MGHFCKRISSESWAGEPLLGLICVVLAAMSIAGSVFFQDRYWQKCE